ncbi:MAG TPA: fluoride efflux transporter CrcB [bacterium]|nr:fluoride efflux transporter CrcB [bacterium]
MARYFVVFAGGGLGATARYLLSGAVYRFMSSQFPYGTVLVNTLGCFLIGFLMTFFQERFAVNPELRLFLTIGMLGGFTTFSTFSYETIPLIRSGGYMTASANVAYMLLNCLGATWVGGLIGAQF